MDIKLVNKVSLDDLDSKIREYLVEFNNQAYAKGIPFIVTCTGRTLAMQVALYAQGRKTLEEVNSLRKQAGLYLLSISENKYKVTWTLDSKHIIRPDRPKALAFDIAVLKNGVATWDLKVDVDKDGQRDYLELAYISKAIGLTPGAFWSNPDFPHHQR